MVKQAHRKDWPWGVGLAVLWNGFKHVWTVSKLSSSVDTNEASSTKWVNHVLFMCMLKLQTNCRLILEHWFVCFNWALYIEYPGFIQSIMEMCNFRNSGRISGKNAVEFGITDNNDINDDVEDECRSYGMFAKHLVEHPFRHFLIVTLDA